MPLARGALAAGPARRRADLGIEDRVDRRTLAGRGGRADDVQVHGGRVYADAGPAADAASSCTTCRFHHQISDSDPNAEFLRAFLFDPDVRLPAGTWDVSALAIFTEARGAPSDRIR